MSDHGHHHEGVIDGAASELAPVLENSSQSVYIYLDDEHKSCNKNFAKLLGYRSPREWADVKANFPEAFVDPKSRAALVAAYRDAMEQAAGSQVEITWKKKDGTPVKTKTILVPFIHQGHALALHFITEV